MYLILKSHAKEQKKIENSDIKAIYFGTEFDRSIHLNNKRRSMVGINTRTYVQGVLAAVYGIAGRYRQVTAVVAGGTVAFLSSNEYLRSR